VTRDPHRSESMLIARLKTALRCPPHLARPTGADGRPLDFVDDLAALNGPADSLLWTVDMLMDGVDFDSHRHSWAQIGRKAMAVNLSDCAAMAVRPLSALCAVALNDTLTMDDAVTLVRSAHDMGLRYDCPIVGGDTNSWNAPTVISISIAARPEPGQQPVRRDGARPGDLICVTGPLGGSILGRHLDFEPRIQIASEIVSRAFPHAMIDISDGLALDLYRVLEASRCGAVIDARALAALIHADARVLAAQDGIAPREHALFDGEDFELIVVVKPDVAQAELTALGLAVIGRIEAGSGLRLREADGREVTVARRGWEHFT
jgi:thiamine-monophosphate kinase